MRFLKFTNKRSAQNYIWALLFIASFLSNKGYSQKISLDKLCILTQITPFDQIQYMATQEKWELTSASTSDIYQNNANNKWYTSEYFNNQNFYQSLETKFDVRLESSNPYADKKEYCLIQWKSNSDFIFNSYLKKCSKLDSDQYPYVEHLIKANFSSYEVNLEMSKTMRYNNCVIIFYQDESARKFILLPIVYLSWVQPIVERQIFSDAGTDTAKLMRFIQQYPKSQFADSAEKKIKTIDLYKFKKRINTTINLSSPKLVLEDLKNLKEYIRANKKSPWIKAFISLRLNSYYNLSMKSGINFITNTINTIEFQELQKVQLRKRIDTLTYLKVSDTIKAFLEQSTQNTTPVYRGLNEIKAQISQLNKSFKLKCEQRIKSRLFVKMKSYIESSLDCEAADIFTNNFPNYKSAEVKELKKTCVSLQNNRKTRDSLLSIIDTLSSPYTLKKSEYANILIRKINTLDKRVIDENTKIRIKKWKEIDNFHEKNISNKFQLNKDFPIVSKGIYSSFTEQLLKVEDQYKNKQFDLNFKISTTQNEAWLLEYKKLKGENRFLNGSLKEYKKILLNKAPLLVYGNMVNATDNFLFSVSNQSRQYHADYDKKLKSFDKKNRFFNKLENSQGVWQPGHYIFEKRNTSINDKSFNTWRIVDYKHFAGPTAVFSSLLVPGNGTNKVNGNRSGDWVTATVYTLFGIAALYYSEAQTSYDNYSNTSIQSNMNGYYDDYVAQMNTAKYLTYAGAGVYGINLLYVFSKGLANLTKSVHYTNKYRPLTFPQ